MQGNFLHFKRGPSQFLQVESKIRANISSEVEVYRQVPQKMAKWKLHRIQFFFAFLGYDASKNVSVLKHNGEPYNHLSLF